MVTYMSTKLALSVALLPAVVASTGLGAVAVLAPKGETPISGGYQEVASAAAAATLLADTKITADGNKQLQAVFAQDYAPTKVYVATYDPGAETPETPATAAGVLETAGVDVGILVPASVTDSELDALGTWLAADGPAGPRRWRYIVVAESKNSSLIASGAKPSAIDGLESPAVRLLYGASDQGIAGAYAGRLQGRGMVRGPTAAEVRVLGVALPGLTDAQIGYVREHDVGVLLQHDLGAGATERVIRGTHSYDGTAFTAVCSTHFAVRRMTAALKAMLMRHAISGAPLLATAVGVAEVTAELSGVLAELAGQGHFVPGVAGTAPNEIVLPDGYAVSAVVVGDDILATVILRLGQEVDQIQLSVTGQIV